MKGKEEQLQHLDSKIVNTEICLNKLKKYIMSDNENYFIG